MELDKAIAVMANKLGKTIKYWGNNPIKAKRNPLNPKLLTKKPTKKPILIPLQQIISGIPIRPIPIKPRSQIIKIFL